MGILKRIIQEIVEWEQKRHDVNEKSVHDTENDINYKNPSVKISIKERRDNSFEWNMFYYWFVTC